MPSFWPPSLPKPFSASPSREPLPPTQPALPDTPNARPNALKDPSAALSDLRTRVSHVKDDLNLPPSLLAASAFALGGGVFVGGVAFYRRFLRRVQNAGWVTPDMLAQRRWIRGVVTAVGDADGFRLYHTPGIGWYYPFKFRRIPTKARGPKSLSGETITIRIAGADAPEGNAFGKVAQPGYAEALTWLKGAIEGRTVWVQLAFKDQYQRVVAVPYLPPRFLPARWFKGKSLSLTMLRAGHASVYQEANAEYSPWGKDAFLAAQDVAQKAKRGMWKAGNVELPSEYKRRMAARGGDVPSPAETAEKTALETTLESDETPAVVSPVKGTRRKATNGDAGKKKRKAKPSLWARLFGRK